MLCHCLFISAFFPFKVGLNNLGNYLKLVSNITQFEYASLQICLPHVTDQYLVIGKITNCLHPMFSVVVLGRELSGLLFRALWSLLLHRHYCHKSYPLLECQPAFYIFAIYWSKFYPFCSRHRMKFTFVPHISLNAWILDVQVTCFSTCLVCDTCDIVLLEWGVVLKPGSVLELYFS